MSHIRRHSYPMSVELDTLQSAHREQLGRPGVRDLSAVESAEPQLYMSSVTHPVQSVFAKSCCQTGSVPTEPSAISRQDLYLRSA
eukprot:6063455-Amphidinium_carterae.1